PIPRGSVSAVFRCRMADGRRAVLKASPDRVRLAIEAAALDAWHAVHTPAGDRARRATWGASDRGDRTRNAAGRLLDLPCRGKRRRAPEFPARKRCSRPVLSDGQAARRLPVRLLGEPLRTSPGAHGADPAGSLRARAPARDRACAGRLPDRPATW